MADRRNASAPSSTSAGVLRPDQLARFTALQRIECSEDLGPWVENFWTLTWDLPPGASYLSSTLPHPACTLSVERGHHRDGVGPDPVVVTGVITRRFDVTVRDAGWVFAAKFRPGGLASLTGVDAGTLRDRTVPAAEVLDPRLVAGLRELDPHDDCRERAESLLRPLRKTPEPAYRTLLEVIGVMLEDRSLVQVQQVEARCGIGARRLQRLFSRYVGATPKWVLARYRMHDVVDQLDAGYDGSLADLAAAYGWFDQAHFTREFTELVGETPGSYQRLSGG